MRKEGYPTSKRRVHMRIRSASELVIGSLAMTDDWPESLQRGAIQDELKNAQRALGAIIAQVIALEQQEEEKKESEQPES